MNSVYFERRSIRKFKNEPVSKELIDKIIEVAMTAPSARGIRPWHFVIIDSPALLNKIPEIHPYASMVPKASCAILVCGDLSEKNSEAWWPMDCSAVCQNILLAVTESGLGAVWLGCYPRGDRVAGLKDLLKLPEHIIPFALIPIGHPAESKGENRYFCEEKIHKNGW